MEIKTEIKINTNEDIYFMLNYSVKMNKPEEQFKVINLDEKGQEVISYCMPLWEFCRWFTENTHLGYTVPIKDNAIIIKVHGDLNRWV